ncbi:MAG: HEAT repeat domain-containing protein, partial [Actinobacteria bacterium]|nr:HEAT repeat domain-containing protein [Actinomycetota bacterium]
DGAAVREPIPTGVPEAVAVRQGGAGVGQVGDSERSLTGALPAARSVDAETVSTLERLRSTIDLVDVLALLWLIGASAILARLVVGMVTLRRYSRSARPAIGPSWEAACEWARSRLLLDTPVRILVSDEVSMPLAAGVVHSVVLMPQESEHWPDERRRAVLLHEMAHIKRRDVLPHLMAWVVCALWWFHPLAWNAARRMRSESEKACDDLVLKVGTRASRYADDLLDIVTRAGTTRAPATVMPLAQRSEFEGRILAILEPDRRRRGVSVARAALVALAVALLAVPLAAVGPSDSDSPATASEEVQDATGRGALRERLADLVAKNQDEGANGEKEEKETLASNAGAAETPEVTAVPGALVEPEIVVAEQDRAVDRDVDREGSKGTSVARSNGRAVAAVAATLDDNDPTVRLTAAETLGRLEDPRAIEALTRALRQDPDAKVRAMAAWALGQIEDPAAVPALSDALRDDEDVVVRQRAAEALGDIEDASAIDALGSALRDPSVEVRRTAVWALGMIEDARAVPLVLPFLEDQDVEVRRNAAEALGDIESPQAVDALIPVTRDGDVEVRLNAINALGNIEDSRALPALVAALGDEAVVIRREAIDAIGNLDLTSAPREVIDAVGDPDREVRQGAIDALDNFEDPAAVPVLLEVVRTSTERDLQYDALDALSNIGSPAVYDALIPLLQHEDPKIRQLAAQAIGNIE